MNTNIRSSQGGFTLIELVIVIVILGILAAVAVPRFIDLSDEAEAAALQGVAGAMASAMAINFAGCAANDHTTGTDCVEVDDCDDTGSILQGGLPSGYTVAAAALSSNGTSASCTVTQTSTTNTASFDGIGAGQ